MTPRTLRRIAVALAIACAVVAFRWLVADQAPRTFWDSSAYLEIARRPFSWWHVFYPKPVVVPAVYRLIGAEPDRIAAVQEWLALAAWAALGAAAWCAFVRPRTRIAAAVVVVAFALEPVRLGFCDAILSESIDDSVMALMIAAVLAAIALPADRRHATRALGIGAAVLAAAWVLARDTNAAVILAAAPAAAWWLRRRVPDLAALGAVAALAVFALWSTSVAPPPTGLSFHSGWPADFLARGTYSTLNNIVDRALPDPDGRAFFRAHGMPEVDEVAKLDVGWKTFAPEFAAATTWIAADGRAVFVRWLLAHPLTRVAELASNTRILLGADDYANRIYMPPGWRDGGSHGVRRWVSSELALIALGALAVLAVWRARAHPVAKLAAVLVLGGGLGSAAAFYGDSSEVARHCYGSGQLCVLGLYLGALALLDLRILRTTPKPVPPRGINDQ